MSQHQKILTLLDKGDWVCTSSMYALFIADPRKRLCELKEKGYQLESRRCQQHNYHDAGSKEWRLTDSLPTVIKQLEKEAFNVSKWLGQWKPEEIKQQSLFK